LWTTVSFTCSTNLVLKVVLTFKRKEKRMPVATTKLLTNTSEQEKQISNLVQPTFGERDQVAYRSANIKMTMICSTKKSVPTSNST
jgi:hypothetical protein